MSYATRFVDHPNFPSLLSIFSSTATMPSQRPSGGSSGPSRRRQASSESEDSDAGDTSTQVGSQAAEGGGGRGGLTLKVIDRPPLLGQADELSKYNTAQLSWSG